MKYFTLAGLMLLLTPSCSALKSGGEAGAGSGGGLAADPSPFACCTPGSRVGDGGGSGGGCGGGRELLASAGEGGSGGSGCGGRNVSAAGDNGGSGAGCGGGLAADGSTCVCCVPAAGPSAGK